MKPVGKPDAGDLHVRFDEQRRETERRPGLRHRHEAKAAGQRQLPGAPPPLRRSLTLQVRGRKRHILVDTLGFLPNVVVHPANVQDRDGAFKLLRRARRLFPFIERIFAGGGYAGKKMARVVWRTGTWQLEIVKLAK